MSLDTVTWTRQGFDPSVATVIVTACANEHWRKTLSGCHWPTYVVCHQADFIEASAFPAVKLCMAWHGPFDWGGLTNIAMKNVTEEWVMFLHDDASSPTRDEVESMLNVANKSGSQIVVPAVVGDSRCERQSLDLKGWSHLTEIMTDACALVKRSLYDRSGGFPPTIPGVSFELPWLQLWLYKDGGYAAIDHDTRIRHYGSATFDGILTVEERRKLVAESMKWSVGRLNLPSDYNQRIGVPRLVERKKETGIAYRYPLYVEINGVRFAVRGDEKRHEIVQLAVNHSPNDVFEYEGQTYRRFARGDKFIALERKSQFKIGAHNRLGFGDTFFMMKLFACLKKNYPECEIEVHSDISNADLFERCTDVDRVVRASYDRLGKDGIDIHRFGAFGIENAPNNLASHFGLKYDGEAPNYKVWPRDEEQADTVLKSHGRDSSKPLLAVQTHGGWEAKRWCHTSQFIRQACLRGYQVWLIGINDYPRFRIPGDVIRTGPLALTTVLACLAKCEAIVGFDSGAVHAAAAVKLPSVSLWGPHDPRYILLDAKVYNTFAVRKRNPWQDCGEDNCRHKHGGSKCPLKRGSPGAVCIDEVSTAEVWALLEEAIGT